MVYTTKGRCDVRPTGLGQECGAPAVFQLANKDGDTWGACFEHLTLAMKTMAPSGAITAQPIPANWPRETEVAMNEAQEEALRDLCERYRVPFDKTNVHTRFDLPSGYVAMWVGPIYVGCSPEGVISS